MDQLTNTRRSDGDPDPDVVFKEVTRIKISHYRNLYLNHPDPIVFLDGIPGLVPDLVPGIQD